METQTEPVCVVIADATVDEDELRRYLRLSLPVSVTRWERRQYYATINDLSSPPGSTPPGGPTTPTGG